ncbi:MAG: sialidase family protein [Nitrospirota bacterium]
MPHIKGLLIILFFYLTGCGGGTFQVPLPEENPNNTAPVKIVDRSTLVSGGAGSFLDPITITHIKGLEYPHYPSVAADGQTVIVAWDARLIKPGRPGFFVRSIDGGKTFSPPVSLFTKNTDDVSYGNPSVAIDGQNVFMTWAYSRRVFLFFYINRLFLYRSTDGGATFSGPVNIAGGVRRVFNTAVAVDGKTVLVLYTGIDQKNNRIHSPFLTRSTNGGKSFSKPINLSPDIFSPYDLSVAIDGQTVIVSWTQDRDSREPRRLWFARSTDGGATFSPPVNLASHEGWFPSVGISGQTVLITGDFPGKERGVLLARSIDGGATFSTPVAISKRASSSWAPSMAIDGQTVIVAWGERDSSYKDASDIWFVLSHDGGVIFSTPVNLSNIDHSKANAPDASSPSVALDGQTAFVTWTGSMGKKDGLYLARIPLGK